MNFEDLQFVRLTEPGLFRTTVPKELVEQIPDIEFDIENFYTIADIVVRNPLAFIYILIDKDHHVQGLLWYNIDPIELHVNVYCYSVAKEYQRPFGAAQKGVIKFIKTQKFGPNVMGKIQAITTRPKIYERYGWKRSNRTIMEISHE